MSVSAWGSRVSEGFPASVCVVEDDDDFVSFLTRYLEARGCCVHAFGSAEAFLAQPAALAAEFFLIDLMLPGADGVDLIGMIRARSQAGIIVISGRMGPDAFSSALAAGADMFINKPVRFDQVYQAILSVNRRLGPQPGARGRWSFDRQTGELTAPTGSVVGLTASEQRLLARLLMADGNAVTRAELAEAADVVPSKDDRNLDAAMFRMRRKIEQHTREPAPVRTVHGTGYALADVAITLR